MKTIFFEVEEWERTFLEKTYGKGAILIHEPLTKENVKDYADAEIISTFIYSTITKEVVDQLPKLKFVTTRSTGFDHIDVNYCRTKDIVVANVPSYGIHTVAEHTFMLILALAKKLIPSAERARKGNFSLEGLQGFDLNGKVLGVIGAGKIGTSVVHIAKCFGMHVLILKHHNEISDNKNIEYVDLDTLLSRSDVVTLHLPLTPTTKYFINMKNIEKFKKGALLINTARGGLIETQAILEGLEKGILSGVGLDVLEDEKEIKEERELLSSEFMQRHDLKTALMEHMLMDRDDVLITPHKAFDTREAVQEILEITAGNITAFENGKPENTLEQA